MDDPRRFQIRLRTFRVKKSKPTPRTPKSEVELHRPSTTPWSIPSLPLPCGSDLVKVNRTGAKASPTTKRNSFGEGVEKGLSKPRPCFYWVQLCNFRKPNGWKSRTPKKEDSRPGGGDGWAKIREAQTQALDLSHTGMAVIIDLADAHNPNDIHPKNKQDRRRKIGPMGFAPVLWHERFGSFRPFMKVIKSKAEKSISPSRTGRGLMIGSKDGLNPTQDGQNGKLKHFSIAGEDKKCTGRKPESRVTK